MSQPVAAFGARIHGGTDALGAARFDFSTNSNACGPCPAVLAAVQAADATRYPDASYTHLRQALAGLHGVEPWRIVLAGSASEFIFRITAWTWRAGASRVWIPAAAYGDYAHAAQAWSLQRTASLEDADLVWACEPSSPLGQAHTKWPAELQILGEAAPLATPATAEFAHCAAGLVPAGQTLVLDCAYAPLRLSGTPSLSAGVCGKVWQMFSPNKSLALTGVRAAYAIAPVQARQAAQELDAMAASWVVGAHGQALLLGWAEPAVQQWLRQCLPTLQSWKRSQTAMLESLGWYCLPSDTNFFCAQPPADLDLAGLLPQMRGQGIKLRDAASLGLPGHVRLSAQPPEAQQALQAALTAWAATHGEQVRVDLPTEGVAPAAHPHNFLEKSR